MKSQFSAAAWLTLVVVVVLAGAYLLFTHQPQPQEGASPAPSRSASAPATAAPTLVGPTTNPLAVTTPDEFTQRVLDFEEAYQMRDRPDGLSRLAKFGTEQYVKDHTPPPGGKYTLPARNTVITVSRDLSKTAVVVTGQEPAVRYISVTPVISTSRPDANGALQPVDTDIPTHQTHATTWILIDGVWRVNQER